MKLNNQQITALAEKFKAELIDNYNKLTIKEKEKIVLLYKPEFIAAKKILSKHSFINSITINLTKGYSASITKISTFDNWIGNYVLSNLCKTKNNFPLIEDIKNDIILATIDSASVEDIMKTLKQKYK
jgi:hypothetical protein